MDDLIERMEHAARVADRIRERRAEHERLMERVRALNDAAEARQAARVRAEVR